jgi:lysozyme
MNWLTKLFTWLLGTKTGKTVKTTVAVAVVASAGYMTPTVMTELKQWEGFIAKPYTDIAGVRTQGYGHTNRAGTIKIKEGSVWTEQYASEVLELDLKQYWDGVAKYVKVPLTGCQHSVLTMWTYNVGVGAMSKSSLVRELNQGHYNRVPRKLMAWNKATVRGKKVAVRGLTNRRKAEGALWASDCK